MANDRDCENCIHKVNGACTVWDCKFEPKRGMTREEAKALLLNISAYDIDTQRGMKKQEAIEMAIKALEQVPCDKCVYSTSEGCQYDDITETIPPFETSDDAISRQAVLKIIDGWYEQNRDTDNIEDLIVLITYMDSVNPQKPCKDCQYKEWLEGEDLPSVNPKQSWIPVSERLPENKETVLVTFKHFVSGNTIGLGSVILLRGKPHWHVREQNLGTYDVLAWMPLPEPYKAEGSES